MSYLLGYTHWKKLFEQKDDFKQKREGTMADALGVSEEELKDSFLQKIKDDLAPKKSIENIKSESVKSGIVEAFLYSKSVPKGFYKNPEEYKFFVRTGTAAGGAKLWPTLTGIADLSKIPYVNPEGIEEEKSYDEIVSDLNLRNTDAFALGEGDQFYLVSGRSKSKKISLIATKASLGIEGKLLIVSPTQFNPASTKEVSREATTTTSTPGKPGGIINIDVKFNADDPKSAVKFGENRADATPFKDTLTDSIYKLIEDEAKKQGVSDMSTIKITSLKVISSASNQWDGPVTATHSNDGTPTGAKYSDPYPTRKDANYAKNAQSNYTLAQNRGVNLGNALVTGLNSKGITEIAPAEYEARITDTGGVNDNVRTKQYPNAGQYARIIIAADASKQESFPEMPGTQKSTAYFTQFALELMETKGSTGGLDKIKNLFLSQAKYLKANGGWRSKGYIKRHGGGNRPPSGLARWFDNIFYSGIK